MPPRLDWLGRPRMLVSCLVLTFVLRAAILLAVPLEQTSDFGWYHSRAIGIASGAGYNEDGVVTAFWPVGWPGFLGLLFRVTGPSAVAGQIANLGFALAICILIVSLGERLFNNRSVGELAALTIAVYPNQIAYVPLLSVEIFYEMMLLASVWLLAREKLGWSIIGGVILGIATLTKAQTLLFPVFLYGCVLFAGASWNRMRHLAPLLGAVYLALIIVVAPWTYRNWTVFHSFIPVSTNGGWTLLTGNNPEANGDYTPATVLAEGISHAPQDQVAMDKLARDRAVAWIIANPGKFLALIPQKVFRLWALDGEAEWFYQRGYANYSNSAFAFRCVRVINQIIYVGMLILGLFGAAQLVVRRRLTFSPWVYSGLSLIIFDTVVSLVFSGQSRFHFSLMPFLALYASWLRMSRPSLVRDRKRLEVAYDT